jgi:hypothetical protein
VLTDRGPTHLHDARLGATYPTTTKTTHKNSTRPSHADAHHPHVGATLHCMRGRAEGVYASKATIVQLDRCTKTGSAGASLHSYYWQATERWLSTWTLWVADPVTLEVTPGNRNHTRAVLHKYYHNTHPCKPTRHPTYQRNQSQLEYPAYTSSLVAATLTTDLSHHAHTRSQSSTHA